MKGLKIRVPDVPAYMATPKSCGANPTPIAFAEVYLALQNGTVEAQENPLTTIEAKKFYEVQKAIMMTSHIVDGLTTQIAPHVWNKLTDAREEDLHRGHARGRGARDDEIKKREAELVDEFKKKGLQIVHGRPPELHRRGAEERARSSRWASPSRTTTGSSRSSDGWRRRRIGPRECGAAAHMP